MADMPAKLLMRSTHPGVKDTYELGESTTVGRHPTNTIVLGLDSVSRFHARIDKRGNFFIVQDLNSSNGTFVNGERVTQLTLHHSDLVTFGAIEFLFTNEASSTISTSHGSGMSIVDITDDSETEGKPTTESVIKSDEVKEKSSVFAVLEDKKADKQTLMRVNKRLTTLYRLSELLRETAGDREQAIIERTLDLIFDAVVADRGVVMTKPEASLSNLDVSAVKYRDQPINPPKVSISRTILDQVITQKVAVLSRDAQSDARFDASESIIMNQVRSAICVPMVQQGKVMGVVHLDTNSATRVFNKDDLEFVTMIASELSVALENMRMRKESAHRERLAAVGETVAGISHNVKNILLLMQGGSELLNRAIDKQDIESASDSWGVVSRGIDKIGKLVRDMLEYSSNKKPALSSEDVNGMICSIAEEVEDKLVAKGITLELDLEEGLADRIIDEMGMQRTLMNLIVNAMEAISHPGGRINITTSVRADEDLTLIITVGDNGSGIPKDKLERIFLPFYTTKGSSGTGLGLPMCKKVVEDMGGTLRVESEEDVGTTFIIALPSISESTGTQFEEGE
ncbi:FHA domain-containing protein [Candidatus Poribacteria bacterium]|nr:FHA domain-containing protein [Candidatus Poribacteria bacterium]